MKRVRPSCEADGDKIESFPFVLSECLNRVIRFRFFLSLSSAVRQTKDGIQPLIEKRGRVKKKGDTRWHYVCQHTRSMQRTFSQHTFNPHIPPKMRTPSCGTNLRPCAIVLHLCRLRPSLRAVLIFFFNTHSHIFYKSAPWPSPFSPLPPFALSPLLPFLSSSSPLSYFPSSLLIIPPRHSGHLAEEEQKRSEDILADPPLLFICLFLLLLPVPLPPPAFF